MQGGGKNVATRTVVLVEGRSDRVALERLAGRLGYDLAAAGVTVVDVGGVTNFRSYLMRYGPQGQKRRLAGLCDEGERRIVLRALEAAGVGSQLTVDDMPRLGFFTCEGELEDELLAAVGPEAVLAIIEQNGDLPRFRIMQRQLLYRSASLHTQVRYLMTQKKIAYAPRLIDALDLAAVPQSLAQVLEFAMRDEEITPGG